MPKKKQTILIIEDDETLADVYAVKFKMEGYNTLVAKDGIEGVSLAMHENPDLILLDIVLPKMNGFEALKDIKSSKKTKHIPVVVLSNLGQPYEVERGRKLGAEKYLVKANYTPQQVVDIVKDILK